MSTELQRPRRQSPEQTRAQIVAAAVEFLNERPYRELNADALMARVGRTRTLFYRHFDGIGALLLALVEDLAGELMELAEAWTHSDRVGPEEARMRLTGFVEFHTRNRGVVLAVAEAAHHDDAVESAYRGWLEQFVVLTTDAIQRRIDEGELMPLDAPEISRALVLMVNSYLGDPHRTGDPDRALATLLTIWTRTLFPSAS